MVRTSVIEEKDVTEWICSAFVSTMDVWLHPTCNEHNFLLACKALQNEAMTLSSDTPGEQIFAKKKANKKEKRLSVS